MPSRCATRTGDFLIHERTRGPPFGILPEHPDELLTPDFAHRGCCGRRFDSGVIGKGAVAGLAAAVAEGMWLQTATTGQLSVPNLRHSSGSFALKPA
jgi:hypothetical protein